MKNNNVFRDYLMSNKGVVVLPHINNVIKPAGMEIETILKQIKRMKDYDGY